MAIVPEPAVKDSILESTKKLIGLDSSYDVFDLDVTTHINSAFSTLFQAGVGPLEGFFITDSTDTWDRFIGNKMYINDVKTYIYLRVKMLFDPPTSSFALEAIKSQIEELIWRLNVADDHSAALIVLPAVPTVLVYELVNGEFPPEAPLGALGFDPVTGNVWRNV